MANAALVDSYLYLDEGRKLVRFLREEGLKLAAAFWLYDEEVHRWSLFVALPTVQSGTRKAIESIHLVMAKHADDIAPLTLDEVTVIDSNDPRALELQKSAGPTWVTRLRGVRVDGGYLDDALVYDIRAV